jgi:hypothetical protein
VDVSYQKENGEWQDGGTARRVSLRLLDESSQQGDSEDIRLGGKVQAS